MSDLTPLQLDVKAMLQAFPELDDKEIARKVFSNNHPDERYENRNPSPQYVGKLRSRFEIEGQAPEIQIETPDEAHPTIIWDEDREEPDLEPEIPFEDIDFEIPEEIEIEEPEVRPDVEGPTTEDVEFMITFTFDKFAEWTGWDGWRFATDARGRIIDRNERRFVKLSSRMMDKYLPDILDLYFLEFMFCWTALMIVGQRAAGYYKWRKAQEPLVHEPLEAEYSTINEETDEKTDLNAEDHARQEPTNDEPEREPELPYGARAHGEAEFTRRIGRKTP